MPRWSAWLLVLSLGPAWPALGQAVPDRPIDFSREIRPIFSNYCFRCHGPDPEERQTEMRLDTKAGAFAQVDSGRPIVPGKPAESEIVRRITSHDPELRMPPDKFGKKLAPAQIALIQSWIEQGANWKEHWAYQTPERPAVPAANDPGFVRNEIDRFVLARLQAEGLKPSPAADRTTLVRRLSFDLRGLPPTLEEVDEFLRDTSDTAYEKLIDRMLASPHFGERMALYWLDLARFADTGGYHSDNHRDLWLYRDYVIAAFNENVPFDRFTREQLAGDLLPGSTTSQRIASGYNRLLMTTEEGGGQAKEYLAKYSADRVRNTASLWLGATLGCAECHDHKYDPFTTRDFYRFGAFFADLQEVAVGRQPQTPFPDATRAEKLAQLDQELAKLKQTLDGPNEEWSAAQARWEESQRTQPTWITLQPRIARGEQGTTLTVAKDGTIVASGTNPERDVYQLVTDVDLPVVTALRLEVFSDPALPAKGPGRSGNGNFVLNEFEVLWNEAPVKLPSAWASHSQKDFTIDHARDGQPQTGWAILPQTGKDQQAIFETAVDLQPAATGPREEGGKSAKQLTVRLQFTFGGQHSLGRFRLSATGAPRPVRAPETLPKNVADVLKIPAEQRNAGQKQALTVYYRSIAPELAALRQEIDMRTKDRDAIVKSSPSTLVSMSVSPRAMRILPRGNWMDDSGEVVQPGVPGFLPQVAQEKRATRLDLADWMLAPENPLVARVFVNRLWMLMYGRGIVNTLDDLGSQGAQPTHPELLDWLAVDFREHNWDIKRLLRLMLNSGTYRQTSFASADLRHRDPFNLLLARQGRFRIEAELVRDNALSISGLLVRQIGGPSVKPYQPPGYWQYLNFPRRDYVADQGDNQYRRGLYTYWQRTFLHPSLRAFDASSREECTVDRPRSNTPLQALVLLNDPTYVEAARAFAERVLREAGPEPPARLDHAARLALSRPLRPAEVPLLLTLLAEHRQHFQATPNAANELLQVGLRPLPANIDRAELAAWTSVCRVLLNLHETVTRL